jgi:hypothetical protein
MRDTERAAARRTFLCFINSSTPARSAVKLLCAATLLLAGAFNCQAQSSGVTQAMHLRSDSGPRIATLAEIFEIERSVTLKDDDRVTTVLPILTIRRDGGFLVTDPQEYQVRRYDSLGNLRSYFGGRGNGPGEFTDLVGAVELSNGEIVAAEATGRLTWLNRRGRQVRSLVTGLDRVFTIAALNDSTVILTGKQPGRPDGPLIHVWDLKRNVARRAFFRMPRHARNLDRAYAYASAVDVAVRGDTAAAIQALSDTVYFFNIATGQELPKMPIPSRYFRHVRQPPPKDLQEDVSARVRWSGSFSRVSKLFWSPEDGSLYVTYFDMEGRDPRWSLVHMRRGDTPSVEVRHIPRLLAVSSLSRLVFIHPESLEPNQWVIGTRSSGS